MSPLFALLLTQTPSTAEAIHAEDSRAIEAALLGYWRGSALGDRSRPGWGTLYVPALTEGPWPISRGADGQPPADALWSVEASLRASYRARNAVPVSLAWFRPTDARIRLVAKDAPEKRGRRPEFRQYVWLAMPGYSKDRTRALVGFSFNEGAHSGQAMVWLERRGGVWRMKAFRDAHFL